MDPKFSRSKNIKNLKMNIVVWEKLMAIGSDIDFLHLFQH